MKFLLFLLTMSFVPYSSGDETNAVILKKIDGLRSSNPEQSQILLKSIDEHLLTENEKRLYQYLTGYHSIINGQPNEALEFLQPLVNTAEDVAFKTRVLGTLLTAYMYSNDWQNALEIAALLQKHIEIKSPVKSTYINTIKFELLSFYNNIGEHEEAKKLSKKLLNTPLSKRLRCITYIEWLNSEINTSTQSITVEAFKNGEKLCSQVDEPIGLQGLNAYWAEFYIETQQPQKALNILINNLPNVETINYPALTAGFKGLLAKSYFKLEQYEQAEYYAKAILDSKQQHNYHSAITGAYKILAEIYDTRQQSNKALHYYKSYQTASQEALDKDNAKQLAIQKAKLDALQKNNQIRLLDKENSLLRTQALLAHKSAQNRQLILAMLTVVLFIMMFWTYKNRRTYTKIRHMAETDELTGIANRHYFSTLAGSAISFCKKTRQPVSFVLFDLDFFKKINDNYGHQVGDKALKLAVDAAKLACRKNDIIGRLGGEEFAIILPGCGNHLAAHIAEKCRKEIAKADYLVCGYELQLTASFGVSDSTSCSYEFDKLFAGADNALYQSKHLGRDQVFSYQPVPDKMTN